MNQISFKKSRIDKFFLAFSIGIALISCKNAKITGQDTKKPVNERSSESPSIDGNEDASDDPAIVAGAFLMKCQKTKIGAAKEGEEVKYLFGCKITKKDDDEPYRNGRIKFKWAVHKNGDDHEDDKDLELDTSENDLWHVVFIIKKSQMDKDHIHFTAYDQQGNEFKEMAIIKELGSSDIKTLSDSNDAANDSQAKDGSANQQAQTAKLSLIPSAIKFHAHYNFLGKDFRTVLDNLSATDFCGENEVNKMIPYEAGGIIHSATDIYSNQFGSKRLCFNKFPGTNSRVLSTNSCLITLNQERGMAEFFNPTLGSIINSLGSIFTGYFFESFTMSVQIFKRPAAFPDAKQQWNDVEVDLDAVVKFAEALKCPKT